MASFTTSDDYRENTEGKIGSSIPENYGGNYYKEILKKLSVPSLPTLLLSFSAITLSYAHILRSITEYVIGTVFLLLSLIAFYTLFKNNSSRESGRYDINRYTPHTELKESQRAATVGKSIKPGTILFPIPIALLLFLRIIAITNQSPVVIGDNGITAEISEVKQLRYNQQIALISSNNRDAHGDATPIRFIAYCPKDIEVNRNDIVEIFSKPQILDPQNQDYSAFKKNLIRRGFRCIFYLKSGNFKTIRSAPQTLKKKIRKKIEGNISRLFNGETASLLKALYFGNKNFIHKSTIREFKRAGVLHVLAASGLHIGIIASIPLLILGFARINRNLTLLATTLILLFYLYITDLPVSLFRAFTMFFIYGIQRFFDLDKNIFNTLFLSALFILSLYPYELYSPGFQLSFGATFGIILLFNLYRRTLSFLPPLLSNSFALTLSAQIFVYPIIWFHMNEVNINGIISNVLVIPGIAITLITSIITNILSPISTGISGFTAHITDYTYHCIHQFVQLISKTEGYLIAPDNTYILLMPYMLIIIPLLPFLNRRRIMCVSIIAGYMLAFFLIGDRGHENQIVILKRSKTDIIICKKGESANLIGDINSYEDAREINKYLLGENIDVLNVFIPVMNYKNVKYFGNIIKRAPVSTCTIPPTLTFAPYLREFFTIIDIDKINLKINEFPARVSSHNYRKQLLKAIEEHEKEPKSSLFRLYYLLKDASPEKLHQAISEDRSISRFVILI